MASKVDIWNLALSHLGNKASVADPDEASAEANHCRRFYPIVLRTALEAHAWNFATLRKQMAVAENPVSHWTFAYYRPADCLVIRAVLLPGSSDDSQEQDYAAESNEAGDEIIYTNVDDAVIKYTRTVEDTNRFSHHFVMALSYYLASTLVGPIVKDPKRRQEMTQLGQFWVGLAQTLDANQKRGSVYKDFIPAHLAARTT